MIAILGLLGGGLMRMLPSIGDWIGGWFKDKAEAAREERALELQIRLEDAKAKSALEGKRVDAESARALAEIQASIEDLRQSTEDRKSARAFASLLHQAITATLETGEKMSLPKWLLGLGWFMAVTVETFSAVVQPMIAFTVFSVWTGYEVTLFVKAYQMGGNAIQALQTTWTVECWMLLDSVIGFFLAGRVMKGRSGAASTIN